MTTEIAIEHTSDDEQASGASLRVLLACGEASCGERLSQILLDRIPCEVVQAADSEDLMAALGSALPFQIVVAGASLLGCPESMERIRRSDHAPEIVVLTEPGSPAALDLLRAGAFQCIDPSASGDELEIVVHRAAEVRQLRTGTQRAEQLETLRTISLAMTSTFDRGDLLRIILEEAVGLLKAEGGGIYELHPERGELTIIADYQRPPHLLGVTLKVGEGIAGQLVENGASFMIVDDYNQWSGRAAVYRDQRPFGAALEVPLRWGESVIGVLFVDDRLGRKFTHNEANLLKLFADQAAIALVNSNLAQRNEARRRKLQQLAEATREIMAAIRTQSLDELLDPIARYLAEITDAEVASVLLVRRPGFLRWEASFGHREGAFPEGAEFEIVSGDKTGLTGHIAYEGKLVNLHGDELIHHFAARGEEPASPSKHSYSLLAIPLKKTAEGQDVVGLLRAENKKGADGHPHSSLAFTDEDEEVIKIFAEAVVVALELAEQKDLLDRLVESSPDGIIAIDPQGLVTLFNEQAQRALGYSEEEVLGTDIGQLYANPRDPRNIGSILHSTQDGRISNYETAIRSKAGEVIPIRHSSTWIYNSRGERIGSVGYFQDLRSFLLIGKRLEALLEASGIVAQAESLAEGLTRLTEMLAILLPHTFCRILLWDEVRGSLEVQAVHVRDERDDLQPLGTALSRRMEIAEWPGLERLLERGGEPQLLRLEYPKDVLLLQRLSRWLGLAQDLQYVLLAPLRLTKRAIGLIELGEVESARPFSQAEINFADQIATNMTALIDRMRLSAAAEQRGQLLAALDEASRTMLGERETSKLLQQIIQLAVELVGCTAGGLFENRPHLEELDLTASYEIPDQPAWRLRGRSQTHHEGLVGQAARSGEIRVDRHYLDSTNRDPLFEDLQFETAAAVPLKISRDVEAVLFIADRTGHQQFGAATLDVLGRFAVQASMALHLSRLMNPEARSFRHLKILHEISDYIQQADDFDKLLHVVLTGITASYGLGFNRAALFLYDEPRERLVGRMGIGHLDRAAARQDWEAARQRGLEQFSVYLKVLDSGELPETPVAHAVRELVLPLRREEPEPLSRAVIIRLPELLPAEQLNELPEEFRAAFQPSTELLVVPLEARGQILGVLVADNKINSLPITQGDIETLLTFVTTAAIAIDKYRLLQETQIARERLQACFQASNALVSSQEPEQVLRNILERTPGIEEERVWVKLLLVDELGKIQTQMVAGTPERPELLVTNLRPHGFTLRVMRTAQPMVIEDRTELVPPDESPLMVDNGIAAAIGLPFLLHGSPIGVMWIYYDHPRRFEFFEIDALQLYVNQSAMAYDSARRMDELRRLHAAAQAISNARNLHDVLHAIAHQVIEVCSSQIAVVWPYDQEEVEFVTAEALAVGVTPSEYQLFGEIEIDGEGLADVVSEEGWIAVPDVLDFDSSPLSAEMGSSLNLAGVASFQAIALAAGGELIGILFVGYHETRSFGEQDRRTLEAFASHAALSLHNIRLFDQVKKAKQAAELVAHVTTLEKRDTTLQTIADAILEAVGCSAVVLFSYSQREDRWSDPPAHAGVRNPEKAWPSGEESIRPGSIVPRTLRLSKPHVAEDLNKSDLLKGHSFAMDEGILSCVAIPLEAAGRKVGVMFINYRKHHTFTPEILRDIELFAYQAAVAILNSQLFEALEKDQLRALQEFQHQIRGPIFQVHSRLQKLLADYPPDSSHLGDLETIGALSSKTKRVSTYIQLYALLSRGAPLETRDVELPIDDLIQLLSEGAHYTCLTTSPNLQCTFRVDNESFTRTGIRTLTIDRNLFEHAVGNVLDNAFKYSHKGTEVRIRGGWTEDGWLRITIINRGIPILPHEVHSCVDRGWQSIRAKLSSSDGQGIGLWIVDHILRSLGGKLEIIPTTAQSETEVSLIFPANRIH